MLRAGLISALALVSLAMVAPGAPIMPASADTNSPSKLPATDQRAIGPPHTLNTLRTFPKLANLAEWEARRAAIREQILVSCGLWPLPPKTPLRARIFGKVARDGYTIEKVYFQTYPGFYLAGNLYRPLGSPAATHPGVLITHGHWEVGRMADGPDGSIPARAITFARQGYVAFTYDMVGYNDTRQVTHRVWANDRRHWLWGVSEMGLQTWNSIRALDFLSSLTDVDKSRLAITGESGGGTQTMLLGAIDDRLAAVGPCVMVSHSMQGGCLCENAPGLRVDYSNMEIAACAAPKPQIMVGATGDWTRTMMTVEGPGVASVYQLYGKPGNEDHVIFPFNHNINQTSREAVYAFFGKTLLHETDASKLKEPPYKMEPVADLRVFPDDTPLPSDAKTPQMLTDSLILLGQTEIERRKPHDRRSLTLFQKTFLPAWQHTLAITTPDAAQLLVEETPPRRGNGYTQHAFHLGRADHGDNIPAILFVPTPSGSREAETKSRSPKLDAVVLVHPNGKAAFLDSQASFHDDGSCTPGALVKSLLAQGQTVLLLDTFLTGVRASAEALKARQRPFGEFFDTYNRTNLQERVQDILTSIAYLRTRPGIQHVGVVGQGEAGLWALLAAPAADAVAADCDRTDLTTDDALLTEDLYAPGLRRLGDFHTAAVLAAPHPLLLHNTGDKFAAAAWIQDVYGSLGAIPVLHTETDPMTDAGLTEWLGQAMEKR
ncbi:MAG: Acetyl xylan esterase [Chthonomonadaceae bacterium]|nr:Acetyl xylan esterase [Chthonomonadaceae bacterium]